MVEDETGGFTTGIVRRGVYTEQEVKERKFDELIEGIDVIEGCYWDYTIEQVNN